MDALDEWALNCMMLMNFRADCNIIDRRIRSGMRNEKFRGSEIFDLWIKNV